MEDRNPTAVRHAALFGRAGECAALDDVVAAIRGGESRALVLTGDAGVGKTALLEYLLDSAADLTVVRAVGMESEMELAYSSLHQVCAPLLDRLERLPAPQREALEIVFGLSPGAAPDRFLVGLGVLSLLSDAGEAHPLLCVVDDAQWLDHASALTLAFVARRLQADPVAFVFAAREPGGELEHLRRLEVRGLRTSDARAVLESVVGFKLDEQVRDRIIAETRGNPLALLELPRGLTATQLAGGFGIPETEALPGRIEASFARRFEELPGGTRRLLLLAAAEPIGDPLLLWEAAGRLGIDRSAVRPADLDGLLEVRDRVTFRHPLVRSAVYGSASVMERRAVHRALAEVTDRDADPDRRAWHLAAAAAGPDEHVAAELDRSAGRAQARGGMVATAAFLERAVSLTADPPRRLDRALAAADACLQAGAFDKALELVATAESGALDELQLARIELLRGEIALFSTQGSDAPTLLLKAAQRLERLDIALALNTYLDAWGAALLAGRLTKRVGLLEVSRAARSAPRPDGPARPSDLLLDSLATLIVDGRRAAAPMLREATRTFAEDPSATEATLRWGWLTVVPTYALWDEESTYAICLRQLDTIRRAGALARLQLELATFDLLAVRCGDFASAEGAITEADALSKATGAGLTSASAMRLAAFRGREETLALIESVRHEASAAGQGVQVELTEWLLALLCNGLGRHREAVAAAAGVREDRPEEPFVSTWTAIELIEAATRSDEPRVAQAALERVDAATTFAGTNSALGMLARCRALLSDGKAADELYREAIDRLGRSRLRPELARAHLLYGEWLRRTQRPADARKQLRAAYDQFASIGMQAFAERTYRELAATGEKARTNTVQSTDELSAQERQIAQLARDGLTNPEIGARLFLSPRTVEWHLGKIFGKLGIRSRRELSRVLPSSSSQLAPA
jgi:DNA-binding CsgD family transcriptional regulator/tetratricopeptide (TPR) repeat protein